MTQWFDDEEGNLKARETLLNYYSSECRDHGSYILTVAVSVFAFLQIIDFLKKSVVYSNFIIGFILSGLVTVSLYIIFRTISWGWLASYALHVREMSVEDAAKRLNPKFERINLLIRLHYACIYEHNRDHKWTNILLIGRDKNFLNIITVYFIIFLLLGFILSIWFVPGIMIGT